LEANIENITDPDLLDFIEKNKTKVWERDGSTSIFSDEEAKKVIEDMQEDREKKK